MSIFNHFKHLNLSQCQETALTKLEAFLASPVQVFMLKGYAGSGKTTILKGYVEYLTAIGKDFSLMAPTGRAAKVIREKTGQEAFTIHKSIYSLEDLIEIEESDSFYYYYKIRNNVDVSGTIFIVDEASMLSDAENAGEFFRFGTSHLLSDLITYTRVAQSNVNTKIIFVGDPCQLPPVGDISSKAFDANYLKEKFNLSSIDTEMKEVKRQGEGSGILSAAAKMRRSISSGFFNDFNLRSNGKDIFNPTYEAFFETWREAGSSKIIIASKNKTCLDLNLQIRERRFGNANLPVQKGDTVIMGGNNYLKNVFNGEYAIINEVSETTIQRVIALRGKKPVTLTWREVELIFPDAEINNKIVKGMLLENFLYGDNYLKSEETQALKVDFMDRYRDLNPKSDDFNKTIMKDEFFNCLLLKYGYAVTCHKAQGGEWDHVFTIWDNDTMDGFDCFADTQRRSGKTNQNFYRWAYTAITRSSGKLYALNPPYFNSYSNMTFVNVAALEALEELTGSSLQAANIELDTDLLQQLKELNLFDEPIAVQDHFIRVRHAVRSHYIEIVGWVCKGYEVQFTFQRNRKNVTFKTYFNGQHEFKKPFAIVPSSSQDKELDEAIGQLLKNLPNVQINRNTAETVIQKLEFDMETEEKYPFTRSLFDDLSKLFSEMSIAIDTVEHQQYKERYTFSRGSDKAVLDFEYRKDGSFGRILPLEKKCIGPKLLMDIKLGLEKIKDLEYAS